MSFFDIEAQKYDAWYDTTQGGFVDETETALAFSMFSPMPGSKLLDAGCGTGNFSLKLAEKGVRVTGIDISEEMMSVARIKTEKAGFDVEYRLGNLYCLPFEDESFDAVFSMAAFEFIKEPQKAFDELMRVTKNGGTLMIGTINGDSPWGELYKTKEFKEKTVFKHADFKAMEDMEVLCPEKLVDKGACLFMPPTAPEKDFCWESENSLSNKERGGYICLMWKK
ncbi:MAG: class I SAM-dependent methyltransferase [Peptostreptococcaceae bacterium]|nr:class I SAM-dependent methyltransferase [Peptostreptococcaceae bacterium]